jgi:uncharacterized membrane protein YkoI
MKDRTKMIIIGATVAASAAVPAIASAGGNGNDAGAADGTDAREVDVPITGSDLEKATATALAHVGEGRVTATEVGDEESYYEIEITLDNGRQLDVQLDEQFNFVGSEDEGAGFDD